MTEPDDAWVTPEPATDAAGLVVDVAGYEGPLDVLLTLARAQKVDLTRISILDLVEQYLAFIAEARRLQLELAADYLVMAAWLAYLKSRLLLPKSSDDEEPSAEELSLRLQLRLQRLQAMREAGARLMASDRLGRDVFARAGPEGLQRTTRPSYDVSFYELLKAYAAITRRGTTGPLTIKRAPVYSLEEALERLSALIGSTVSWTQLREFLPPDAAGGDMERSAVASLFAASLELARQGRVRIRQMDAFEPLFLKPGDRDR